MRGLYGYLARADELMASVEARRVWRVVSNDETEEIEETGQFPVEHDFNHAVQFFFTEIKAAQSYQRMQEADEPGSMDIWEATVPADEEIFPDDDLMEFDPEWSAFYTNASALVPLRKLDAPDKTVAL